MVPPMRRMARVFALLFVAGATAGCEAAIELLLGEPDVDISAPKTHRSHGLELSFPSDWTVEEEDEKFDGQELTHLTIESPGDALVGIHHFRPAVSVDLDDFVAEFTEGVADAAEDALGGVMTMEKTGASDIHRKLLGEKRAGVRAALTAKILGERVPHTLEVYAVMLEDRSLIIFTQVADEDRDKVVAGFDLILDSLALKKK